MKQPSRPPFHNAKLVQSFRGEARAPLPLHPLELALVIVATLHLCFLPWAFGARDPWAQIVSAVLGTVSLVLAAIPRRYSGELAPQGAFILHPWSRLLKFPIFWLGLLFLGYIACQALNPAYLRASAGPYWWLIPVEHIEWLPSGVSAPFERMNAWRMLAIGGGAWTLGCALYIGLTRRISAQTIFTSVVINGAILALLGILQKVTSAKGIFWVIKSGVPGYFASTFYYKNHAGAYFNLILVVAVSLMIWHYFRSMRRMERSSPAPVYAFATVILAAIVFLSNSRTAMALLIGYAVAVAGILLVWRLRSSAGTTHHAVTGLLAAGALTVVIATVSFLNLDKNIEQIKFVVSEQGQKLHMEPRLLARQATWDLFESKPVAGWGAGSFRHIFPIAQRNYDEIYRIPRRNGIVYIWDHAHNDFYQLLAEVGVVGSSFFAIMFIWGLFKAVRLGMLLHPPYLLLLLGLFLPLAHAWLDFPLYNCAIFVTFCAAWVLLIRWSELELNRT